MVYIYAADARNLKDPKKYPERMKSLSAKDQNEILSSRYSQKRIQYLGLALLLKEIFPRHKLPVTASLTDIHESPAFENLHISFSFAKNIIICAISEKEVGCDIRKIEEAPHNLPTNYFSKLERNYLKSFQSQYFNEEYWRLYTMKESYIQMTGETFSRPAKDFEILISEEIEVYRNDHSETCLFEEYYIPGYLLSVCSKDSLFVPEITFITLL